MPSRGYNAGRHLTGGSGINNHTQRNRDFLQSGSPPVLQRAVVVDVIYDPSVLTDAQMDQLEDSIVNPELVEGMPCNAILARMVTNSQDLSHSDLHVFYPLFSSHFQQPVKPGEQVCVLYEDYSGTGNSVGYWITRPSAARQIEDVNFTHHDRNFDALNHPRNMDSDTRSRLQPSPPTFPNGAGTAENSSLQPEDNATNPYDSIVTNASSSAIVTAEEVPRFKKRPGDFAIFGSNNTSIILGQDRTGPALRVTGSNGKDIIEKAGTIDLVAGLGSVRKMPLDENTDPTTDAGNPTSPRVIQNARNKKEVYKTPYKSQKVDNPLEGDPDFLRDLSRVYISMKTKGDKNFGIQFGGDGGIFPSSGDKLVQPIEDLPADEQNGQPFIVLKSEHLRLIAPKKDEQDGLSDNGDIRFVKEGTEDAKDLSLFLMTKEGRVIMVGKDIQLQTHADGKVLIRCKTDSTGDSDPVILYSKFKECIEFLADKIEAMRDSIGDQISSLRPTVVVAAGPTSPIPGLVALALAIPQASEAIKSPLTFDKAAVKEKIPHCQSKWVFVNKENQG